MTSGLIGNHTCLSSYVFLFLLLLFFVFVGSPVLAQDWDAHDPQSSVQIDHGLWDALLEQIVVPYSPKNTGAGLSEWDCKTTQSRIRTCRGGGFVNKNLKGVNLIPYKALNKEFDIQLNAYIIKMSRVRPERLNKDEQLAYWLNVHNALVVSEIYKNYPINSLYKFRDLPRARLGGVESYNWGKKVFTVNGTDLSIQEIERQILFKHWDDPLVLYGLFDGAIGSPRLRQSAFAGHKVYSQLKNNAREFVNAIRMMRLRGDTAKFSIVYAWASDLFDGYDDLLSHVKSYARPALKKRLGDIRLVRTSFYEFDLAEYVPRKRRNSDYLTSEQFLQRGLSNPGAGATFGN